MKRLIYFYVFVLSAWGSGVQAETVAWWRFEAGPANSQVVKGGPFGSAFAPSIPDSSGNGNALSVWDEGAGGYAYRADVALGAIPGTAETNRYSVINTGEFPGMFTETGGALQTWSPREWTIEVIFKPAYGRTVRTLVGRDSIGVATSTPTVSTKTSCLYLQIRFYQEMSISFTDASGYWHGARSERDLIIGYDRETDPEGLTGVWQGVIATSDGSTLSLWYTNFEEDDRWRLVAQTDLTSSGSPDTSLHTGSGDGTDWDAGNFSVGRGLYGGDHVNQVHGYIDEVRLSDTALQPPEFLLRDPVPYRVPNSRLFRFSANHRTAMTGVDPDGLVSWAHGGAGAAVQIESADPYAANDWFPWTQMATTGRVGQVKLWDHNTPDGFSYIPPGTFLMGSPTDEPGHDFPQFYPFGPEVQHSVTLTRGFFMQQTEVTNLQMADILNWAYSQGKISATTSEVYNLEGSAKPLIEMHPANAEVVWNGSRFIVVTKGQENYPCPEVTWFGAQAYCNYLSDREGLPRAVDFSDWSVDIGAAGYRLPTESEWEYACRAGTTTAFHTGDLSNLASEPNMELAGWCSSNADRDSGRVGWPDGVRHMVGVKQPNRWGLFDMHGNVREWCGDWIAPYQPGALTDPTGPESGVYRVSRGGSIYGGALECRSASRDYEGAINGLTSVGFRPVRISEP